MISIIVAISKNNVIGKDNKLLWNIPEDLKHFKEITLNSKIIMGRKTFESLPGILPKRQHIILTKNKNYKVNSKEVKIVYDFKTIISDFYDSDEEVFIIGGGEIYNLFINYCKKLYLTKIDAIFNGDTFFPNFDLNKFTIVEESPNYVSSSNISYKYLTLKRKV
ncbi:MAG: dihydrofolate reductase [Clostridium sp.]|nr:dihydrofolate reductase [Clostridium sp.]MDY3828549.1 dihydrofolate reductase [Clostridium sp.]